MPNVRARLVQLARPLSLAALAVLTAGAGAASAPVSASPPKAQSARVQPASATSPCTFVSERSSDIDGDDVNDVVVGLPTTTTTNPLYQQGNGAVQADLTSLGTQLLFDAEFPGAGTTGDHFGSAVSVRDLNGNKCADLVIGAAGNSLTPGRVVIAFGSPSGVTTDGAQAITPPTRANGDRFGAALSDMSVFWSAAPGTSHLFIGAPGTTVNGVADAGAIYDYTVAPDGTATLGQTITEASSFIGLTPATGDEFGSVMSRGKVNSLMVGVPDRAVNGQAQAGIMVNLTSSSGTGVVDGAQVFSQNTAGVPGSAEAADHFGASLAQGIVGVPGEDIGSIKDAGAVQVFDEGVGLSGDMVPSVSDNENTAGVPGSAERGDRFGAALALSSSCNGSLGIFVGAPGESIGSIADAGAVTELSYPSSFGPCPARVSHQSGLLPGKAEQGDEVGATLSTVHVASDADDPDATVAAVVIGVPFEDLGSTVNAGMIQRLGISGVGGVVDAGYVYGPVSRQHFGAVLGQEDF